MCIDKEKTKVIFKMDDRKLSFDIDLEGDIYTVLSKIAEQMTFFTFVASTCEEAKEIINNIRNYKGDLLAQLSNSD